MNIEFRKIRPSESLLYRKLRLECLKQYPVNFGSDHKEEAKKEKLFFQTHIEDPDSENFVIGGFKNEDLIAIAGFQRYDSEKTRHRGRIIQVYVNPDYQGQNIGYRLMEATLSEAFSKKGIEQVEIDVLTNNTAAVKLYTQLGFRSFGIQKNYLKVEGTYYDHKMMYLPAGGLKTAKGQI